eukprot:Tbor_TRINITY_DN4577_c0_g1::TRINITY_DN4577_c0_g1_i1::g.15836::m.15836
MTSFSSLNSIHCCLIFFIAVCCGITNARTVSPSRSEVIVHTTVAPQPTLTVTHSLHNTTVVPPPKKVIMNTVQFVLLVFLTAFAYYCSLYISVSAAGESTSALSAPVRVAHTGAMTCGSFLRRLFHQTRYTSLDQENYEQTGLKTSKPNTRHSDDTDDDDIYNNTPSRYTVN